MSKVLCPALRIGYAVLPAPLVEPFAELRTIAEDHGPFIDQATLAELISTGAFYSHIRRCRKRYASRLEVFLEGARTLPLRFSHTDGGMNQMGVWTQAPFADEELAHRLEGAGLDIALLSRYALGASGRGLVSGFTAFDAAAIRGGLRRLASALER